MLLIFILQCIPGRLTQQTKNSVRTPLMTVLLEGQVNSKQPLHKHPLNQFSDRLAVARPQ